MKNLLETLRADGVVEGGAMKRSTAPLSPAWPEGSLFGLDIPLARVFGLVGEAVGEDRARIRMPYHADHTNSRGDVHGGALTVLFDCVLSSAVRSHDPANYGAVTVDLMTHFLLPCDGDLIATAHCEQRGRSLCFARGEAHDTRGRLLAIATGTFKLVARYGQDAPPAADHAN